MSDDRKPDEIVSVHVGPPIPGGRLAHAKLADGTCGDVRMRSAGDGTSILPGERLCDIEGQNDDGSLRIREKYRAGPSQVATKAYRDGYDAIFGKKSEAN